MNNIIKLEAERASVEIGIVDTIKQISKGGMEAFMKNISTLNKQKDRLEALDKQIRELS